ERLVTVDRSRLPEPGPSSPARFPAIEKSTLPNGLTVWTVCHAQVPVVAFSLLIRRGASSDPPGKHGLAAMTADMLDEGSGDRSAIEIHEAIARLGTQLETDIGSDAIVTGFTVLSRFTDRALELLADLVVRPAIRDHDVVRVRQLRLHRLTQLRDMPSAIADRAFLSLIYGEHPYGHSPIGTELALATMGVDDVRAFHERALRPSVATLIAVGDCDHAKIHRLALDAFGGWQGAISDGEPGNPALPQPPRLSIVPRASAPQSELRIGHVAVARNTPDYHALVTANMVLGGQFSSRINLNLREDKGFTYGARTAFEFRRRPGPFVLQVGVQTSATAQSIAESIDEISAMVSTRPITAEELRLAAASLTRGYARNFETADQIARAATQLALYDLPDTYFAEFVPRIERLTTDEVTGAVARHLHAARLTTVVVGDYDAVGADLRRLGLGEPVILPPETF
ncbi:MAG TPA: pitrilysin family protein, partial [Vicinamibacterales bacterium]